MGGGQNEGFCYTSFVTLLHVLRSSFAGFFKVFRVSGVVTLLLRVSFKLFRIHVADRGMLPLAIIKDFNVVKDIGSGFRSCPIGLTMKAFPFESGKETFRHRIIITIALPTHATFDPLILEELLEVGTGILTALI